MLKRKKTAIHEAGHAVAHVRLGIQQGLLTIAPSGCMAGAVISEGIETVVDEEGAEKMALAYCAGFASLIAYGCTAELALVGCDDDFEKCSQLIEDWGLWLSLEHFKGLAVKLMSKPKNMAAVALVADYALAHERVDGDLIEALVELSDGNYTKADFERYLFLRSR